MNGPPLLVVVTGAPGSGKTTLAVPLARALGLPLVAKDEVKEALFETLGAGDRPWSRRLGAATYELLFLHAARLLEAGVSLVLEANFYPGLHERRFETLPPHRTAQVHCTAPAGVLLERYRARPRHPGHVDDVAAAELEPRIRAGEWGALALEGRLISVDTALTQPDSGSIAKLIFTS